MGSLEGARLKLVRAKRHIEELHNVIQTFIDSKPYRIVKRENPAGDLVYCVEIVQQLPPELGAIIGDAIHNIRSALDLLAWQLVTAGGGQPNNHTFFPISRTQASFEQTMQQCLAGASTRALRFIKRLKPWLGGNKTLVQLHSLDIVDKHRMILVVGTAHKNIIERFQMHVPWQQEVVRFPPFALNPADRQFPLTNGAELFRIKAAARLGVTADEPQFTFEPCFGEEGDTRGLPLVPTLERIYRHVSQILQIAGDFLI
ncbi:MAG: hypothetical protein ABSF91_11550 [Bacteroidota bacterium]|jgi:hypothetical protein